MANSIGGWAALAGDPSAFSLGPARAERGALLVHGFTGTPAEMRLVGEGLAHVGFAVEGPALAGHVRSTRALAQTRWPDWVESANDALDRLRQRAERVAVVGLSMGGLVTLELARRRPEIGCIGLLATALWLQPAAEKFTRVVRRIPLVRHAALPKWAGSDILDPEMRERNQRAQAGGGMPLGALASLIEFGAHARAHLGDVKQPALIMHSRLDHTVPFACLDALAHGLGSTVIRTVALERSYHVITLDVDRDAVFAAVLEHLRQHL